MSGWESTDTTTDFAFDDIFNPVSFNIDSDSNFGIDLENDMATIIGDESSDNFVDNSWNSCEKGHSCISS